MKIVLIGFMGSGKSTIARHLSNALNIPVLEMDDRIVELSDLESIPQIFANQGEDEFRRLEAVVASEIADRKDVIVSTGGGAIMSDANREAFRSNAGLLVFLSTSFDEICSRLTDISTRPLFQDLNQARQLFQERADRYQKSADLSFITDGRSPEDITREIIDTIAETAR